MKSEKAIQEQIKEIEIRKDHWVKSGDQQMELEELIRANALYWVLINGDNPSL